jgi:hypothetical protein
MRPWSQAGVLLLALTCLSGCLRRPISDDCEWPPDPRSGPLDLAKSADRDHLREDIETAEDQAVRFMDAHHGQPVDPNAALRQCFDKLSSIVVAEHRLTPSQYNGIIGARPPGFDLAVGIAYALLYAWAASVLASWIWRKHPIAEGVFGGAVMIVYVSLAAAGLGVLLGEQWAGLWEDLRIGNGHLSYRLDRVPWGHHRGALFVAGLVLFWLVAALRFRAAGASGERTPPEGVLNLKAGPYLK